MKAQFLIFIAALLSLSSFSQTPSFPKGVYMSIVEIINRNPSQQYTIGIQKRTSGDITMNGGNEYKIVSTDGAIKKSILKKEVWGYSNGDTMLVNGYHFAIQTWYCKMLNEGKYLIFHGATPNNEASAAVLLGGAIAAVAIAGQNFLYVIDPATKEAYKLKKHLPKILEQYPDLKQAFEMEKDKKDNQTLIKYINLVNTK
ncbi:MAG: DUF6563 family protein [Cytophagales bacterium]